MIENMLHDPLDDSTIKLEFGSQYLCQLFMYTYDFRLPNCSKIAPILPGHATTAPDHVTKPGRQSVPEAAESHSSAAHDRIVRLAPPLCSFSLPEYVLQDS
jgi:hypothetical protein